MQLLYINPHKHVVHCLNLCRGYCKQHKYDEDDNVIGSLNFDYYLSTRHQCYKHRVQLFTLFGEPGLICPFPFNAIGQFLVYNTISVFGGAVAVSFYKTFQMKWVPNNTPAQKSTTAPCCEGDIGKVAAASTLVWNRVSENHFQEPKQHK